MSFRATMWAVGVLPLIACSSLEAARKAQDPASAAPGERTARAEEVGLRSDSKLSLDRALEIALQCHPSVAQAHARAEGAHARVQQAVAGWLPQLGFSAGIDRGKTWIRSAANTTSKSHGESLGLSQLIYDFGKTSAAIRQATEESLAAQSDLRAAEIDAVFAVRQAFFGVLKQQELVRVGEETVRQFQKRLEQVEGFVEVGTRVRYDLTKAQVDLGNARLTLVRARTALSVQRALLNQALGIAEEPGYALQGPGGIEEWTPVFERLVEEARQNHPRLAAQMLRERAASSAVDIAVAEFWPRLSMDGAISSSGSLSPVSWTASVAGSLGWILFSGGARVARLEEAVAGLRATRAGRAQMEQQIFFDLRQAQAQWEDARERLKISDLTVKQAEENLTLAQGRYQLGRASSVDLTDAQVTLATARADQVQARYDVDLAVAALKRSSGTLR